MTLTTRIFKSGNSVAVRIPKELLHHGAAEEASIEWRQGAWVIRPVQQRSLAGLADVFREFPEDFMASGRDFHEQKPRDWDSLSSTGDPTVEER